MKARIIDTVIPDTKVAFTWSVKGRCMIAVERDSRPSMVATISNPVDLHHAGMALIEAAADMVSTIAEDEKDD